MRSFCFDASEQKIHDEESLGWFVLDLRAQRPEPGRNANALFPPPTAITCDECVRIKQDICRLFGLSLISSMQISGIPFHQDLMLSCLMLFFLSPFFCSSKLRFSFHILPLITVLIKRHSSRHLTDFPKESCTEKP